MGYILIGIAFAMLALGRLGKGSEAKTEEYKPLDLRDIDKHPAVVDAATKYDAFKV